MHNTGNPIGSKDILDLYDNSENIDYFANSQLDEHPDRFGTKRLTLAGLIKRSMALRNEINDFSGALTFKPEWSDVPMNVSEGVGGDGGALNLQAEALGNRTEINKITSREALRRTYQEVGLNLVDGSFEQGGNLNTVTDILLEEKTGKVYSWAGSFPKVITSSTLPGSEVEFIDKTNKTNRQLYKKLATVKDILTGKYEIGDQLIVTDRGDGSFKITSSSGHTVNDLDILGAGEDKVAILDYVKKPFICVTWLGAKCDGVTDDTRAFERAVAVSSITTNNNAADMRAGTVVLPPGDMLLNNAFAKNPGLVIRGASNGISRMVLRGSGVMLTVQPLRGDTHPYTNTGYGGLFIYDCQIYAADDLARENGTGLLLINCFNAQFINGYVAGFKRGIVLRGSHFVQFRNFYAADEKNSVDNPNEEIFNRGYAVSIDHTSSAGEFESTGFKLDGGWIHNSSFDFENGSNYSVTGMDIEPASRSIIVGTQSHWYDNRFERMDYYAIDANPPRYERFPWFIVDKDRNIFENNQMHSLGANNDPGINPKFKVSGKENKFYFNAVGIRHGVISLESGSENNYVEIGPFQDLKYFSADEHSPYYVENVHLYSGKNTYKLLQYRSYVENNFETYHVSNCISIPMTNSAELQGLSKTGDMFTVTNTDQCRLILNFNTSSKYAPGVYCLKFKLAGNDSRISISLSASSMFSSAQAFPMADIRGGYIFIRFEIKGNYTVQLSPTLTLVQSALGSSFSLSEIELLKFDSGEYVKNNYVF